MKKLLLGSVAVIGMAAVSGTSPALADGLTLDIGGHAKGYVTWHDQDEFSESANERSFDILKEFELHFTGETTLDNGLTVGAHIEFETDRDPDFQQEDFDFNNDNGISDSDLQTSNQRSVAGDVTIDESYLYFSGAWGRFNGGTEDGAAYLLQVAAPSADSNVDGIRQYINPVRYTGGLMGQTCLPAGAPPPGCLPNSIGMPTIGGNSLATLWNLDGLDYDNDLTGDAPKLTYLTPVLNGFQAGISYTPDTNGIFAGQSTGSTRFVNGVHLDDVKFSDEIADYGSAWEAAGRYEGQFDEIGFSVGGGYTRVEEEDNGTVTDDWGEWNVGLDMDWGAFGLGVIYTENNNGVAGVNDENETWVVGMDYSFGAYKIGGSYLSNENNLPTRAATPGVDALAMSVETARWTGGVSYTYGPGMTFRGSISYVDHDTNGDDDVEATSLLAGTQIRF